MRDPNARPWEYEPPFRRWFVVENEACAKIAREQWQERQEQHRLIEEAKRRLNSEYHSIVW